MKIEVLGTGCPNCTALAAAVKASADKLGIEYELTKVTDITNITAYGVMMTPALVIDGTVRLAGRTARESELTRILQQAQGG
jgi:small redox-active disulfide protein 2